MVKGIEKEKDELVQLMDSNISDEIMELLKSALDFTPDYVEPIEVTISVEGATYGEQEQYSI